MMCVCTYIILAAKVSLHVRWYTQYPCVYYSLPVHFIYMYYIIYRLMPYACEVAKWLGY